MICRKYTPEDYDIIEPWFTARGWPVAPQPRHLPSTGFVVEDDEGNLMCAGFLYLTNSKLGVLDWIVTRPDLGARAIKAIDLFMCFAKEAAMGCGIDRLMHFSKDRYVRIFAKRYGFEKAEELSVLVWGNS